MLAYTLKGLGARLRGTALTVVVVAVGVATMAGALVFSDTIHAAYRQLYASATRGAQLTISGRHGIVSDPSAAPGIPAGLIARVSRLPGVAAAAGQVLDTATIVGRDGRAIGSGRFPTLALSVLPKPFDGLRLLSGALPQGLDDVVLDARTARAQGLRAGQQVQVVTAQPARSFRIAGIAELGPGDVERFAAFSLAAAQQLFGKPGSVDQVDISTAPGSSSSAVAAEIQPLLPRQLVVRGRGAQVAVESQRATARLAALDRGVLAFAVVAVLVGAWLIAGTFSVTTTRRARELAILRAIGATRGQVLGAALLEAGAVGLLGAGLGLLAGPLVALGMHAVANPAGTGLPGGGVVVGARSLEIGAGAGLAMVLLAAAWPTIRAARWAPLEALRRAAAPAGKPGRWRLRAGLTLALIGGGAGVILAAAGPQAGRLRLTAIGGGLLILAAAAGGPLLVRALVGPLSLPLARRRGIVTGLAREQMRRTPGRSAVSASSLTVGIALVLVLATYVGGLRAAAGSALSRSLIGQITIDSQDGTSSIPAGAVRGAASLPGLTGLSSLRTAEARIGPAGDVQVGGADPTTWPAVYRFRWAAGGPAAFSSLGAGDVLLEQDTARAGRLGVGSRTTLATGSGLRVPVTVRGIYRDPILLPGAVIAAGWFQQVFDQPRLQDVFVRLAPGVGLPASLATLRRALQPFPGVAARPTAQLAAVTERRADGIAALLYALLGLSLVMALIGIAGTLSLSVHERTRELGVLRALGMSREQARAMVLDESLLTAAIGWLTGVVLGLALAWALTRALAPEGFTFTLPWVAPLLVVVAGLLAGLLGAILPGRRVSRLDVLVAIAHE